MPARRRPEKAEQAASVTPKPLYNTQVFKHAPYGTADLLGERDDD